MEFRNGSERNNDFVRAVLLEIKSKDGLSVKDRFELSELLHNYKYAIEDEKSAIISLLWGDHYIKPLNHIEYQDSSGNFIDPDEGKKRIYTITDKGVELLKSNILESEHDERNWKQWQRNVSFYGAIVGSIISIILLILKIRESLGK